MGSGNVGVVVVTYRSGAILQDCLRAVLADPAVGHVVVVDNGNAVPERTFLDGLTGGVEVIRPSANIGFAAGCNLGAAAARGEYLAFVNPDLILSAGALGALAEELRRRPDAWMAGARLLDEAGREQRGGRRDVLTPWRCLVETLGLWRLFPAHPHFQRFNWHEMEAPRGVAEVPTISGACMVVPARRWRQLGGMDEGFFLHVEDIDLCLRILKAKGKVLYCAGVPATHRGQSSDVWPIFVEWHKTRGMVRYFRKHFTGIYPAWCLWGMEVLIWGRFLAQIVLAQIVLAVPFRLRRDKRLRGPERGAGSRR